MKMSKAEKYAIGIDLGGTNIKLGLVSSKGKMVKKTSVDTKAEGGPDKVISQIEAGVKELLYKEKIKIKGIGIGFPGVVAAKKGTVENPPNLPGWGKVNLGKILTKSLGTEVLVENDAKVAAIGELIFGTGKKLKSFVMITLGTGVGGGIIINKEIYRGEIGAAGEVGHMTIDYKGPKCNCGSYGCIETYAGNSYIVNRVKMELTNQKDSLIWDFIENDINRLTPKIIDSAANEGDKFAKSVIKELGEYIGVALASVSNLLDIGTFVIGGGVAGFGEPLFISIEETIKSRVLISLRGRIKVIPAKLRNDAGVLGASSLVFYHL